MKTKTQTPTPPAPKQKKLTGDIARVRNEYLGVKAGITPPDIGTLCVRYNVNLAEAMALAVSERWDDTRSSFLAVQKAADADERIAAVQKIDRTIVTNATALVEFAAKHYMDIMQQASNMGLADAPMIMTKLSGVKSATDCFMELAKQLQDLGLSTNQNPVGNTPIGIAGVGQGLSPQTLIQINGNMSTALQQTKQQAPAIKVELQDDPDDE